MSLFNICSKCELIDIINFAKLDKNSNIDKNFIMKIIESKAKAIIVIINFLTKFFFYDFTLSITR